MTDFILVHLLEDKNNSGMLIRISNIVGVKSLPDGNSRIYINSGIYHEVKESINKIFKMIKKCQ